LNEEPSVLGGATGPVWKVKLFRFTGKKNWRCFKQTSLSSGTSVAT